MSESPTHWPVISICVLSLATLAPSVHTISETQVHQTQFHEEVTVKFEKNAGKVT